jgi:hypothetical protein
MQLRFLTLGLTAPLALLFASCENLPRLPGSAPITQSTDFHPAEGLAERQPAEIALAPIRNQSSIESLPLVELREDIYRELINRLYSPLDLDFVDRHWEGSSFSGAAPPDALLTIVVTDWDANSLATEGELKATLELRIFDGDSAENPVLWGVDATRTVDLHQGQGTAGLVRDLYPEALRALAEEVIQLLPERDPTVR